MLLQYPAVTEKIHQQMVQRAPQLCRGAVEGIVQSLFTPVASPHYGGGKGQYSAGSAVLHLRLPGAAETVSTHRP
jgi:hypothetical protein